LIRLKNVGRLSLDQNQIENLEPLLDFGELEMLSLRGIDNLPCGMIKHLKDEVGIDAVITDQSCL
jgi:hypothetical protein